MCRNFVILEIQIQFPWKFHLITTRNNSRFYFHRANFPQLFCIYRWLNFAHSPCWLARFPGLVDIVARCSDYTDSDFFFSTTSHTESSRICLCCIIISLLHYSYFFSFWRWWGKKVRIEFSLGTNDTHKVYANLHWSFDIDVDYPHFCLAIVNEHWAD